jgi:8-oxo-dGTP pyrophosphatase MutT (NUDIX family)
MREVVTAVLKKGDHILIVKRGRRVNTFKGKWSCISGRMEKTPMQSVLKEIEEETGIGKGNAYLKREGNPVLAEGEGFKFKVYPFLFEVESDNITLNWENKEYKWILPEEIDKYDTVPKLKEVIKEVLKE